MSGEDQTRELLEKLLSSLYAEQAAHVSDRGPSYLQGQDGQFIGKIVDNPYGNDSILNEYGPYGSPYSNTSIFNAYTPYGSPYGQYSVNNPYCTTPPRLYINSILLGFVTKNQYVQNGIPTEGFLYTLRNNIGELLKGRIVQNESAARRIAGESFIEATDGTFLGSLRPDRFDQDSIFSRFGAYGSRYSQTSIYNRYGPYGGRYSGLSPYNSYSTTPPKVYHNGQFMAYLTVNTALKPRIDPDEIMAWAENNVSRFR